MMQVTYKQIIASQFSLTKLSWGKVCNFLQDVAASVLSNEVYNTAYDKMEKDFSQCEGEDGILLNGHYFDWKEFDTKKEQIISAWLDYFSDDDCRLIWESIVQRTKQQKELKNKK